jgi:hypothetical protein
MVSFQEDSSLLYGTNRLKISPRLLCADQRTREPQNCELYVRLSTLRHDYRSANEAKESQGHRRESQIGPQNQ